MAISEKEIWEKIYQNKPEEELSWFQPYPKTSMEFLELFNLPLTANIIDIGGGNSHFADFLLERGYTNIWVLDISELAIASAKKRLGEKAVRINWVVADITEFIPAVQFDFWHDRAAFHFLTSEEKINNYISIAEKAIKKDGYLVLGTFSENGPEKCSGLDIKQYTEASMSGRFGVYFERIKCIHEDHLTPSNLVQNFLFCSFRRK
jgi:SAM-dependent methyltransferase